MRNKFNYNTRETQTNNLLVKDNWAHTEPPHSDTIKGNITQWEIFDAQLAELEKEREKEKEKEKKT